MDKYRIKLAENSSSLAHLTSQFITTEIKRIILEKGKANISLSGGNTPSSTYLLMNRESVQWDSVHVFLGDERWVDHSDVSSNARMIRSTLLSKEGPGSKAHFYPIQTTELSSPEESSRSYSELISQKITGSPPIFDLILLGLGSDGHTASLFPGSSNLDISTNWTAVEHSQSITRITLTPPVLSAAHNVVFLVSGESKKIALGRLFDESESHKRTPARIVQTKNKITVIADQAAMPSV